MFDGLFIHYLVSELKQIEKKRINKVHTITNSEMYFIFSSRNKLLISLGSETMHLRLTNSEFVNSPQKNSFQVILKKYLESSVIDLVEQYNNDRIIIFSLTHFDELGYEIPIKIYIECFGRNSNMILTTSDDIIIDCYKRCFDEGKDARIIVPKAKYLPPVSSKINPFIYLDNDLNNSNTINDNIYEGISSLVFGEITFENDLKVIKQKVNPTFIQTEKKNYFYAFDLKYLKGNRIYFNTLSELLEYYYVNIKKNNSQNNEQLFLKNYLTKEIEKIKNKIFKQKSELENAITDIKYEKIGNLLKCNMHLLKKGDKELKVFDYETNEDVVIHINPLLSPNQNLTNIFKKYQKSKRAQIMINEQIIKSNNDLKYYECLLDQLSISKATDIYEMYQELNIKQKGMEKARKSKPNITNYEGKDFQIWVGKNNLQNNYLTNTFAQKTDYFFHVQNVPGSHVILRTANLTEENIKMAATVAAYYSSYREATNVCVDYTLVKFVKKIPGVKGSFVTYKNQKSIFVKPDLEYIKTNVK